MKKLVVTFAVIALCTSAATLPALARSAGEVDASLEQLFGEHTKYHQFFDALKNATAADDKNKIAGMIDYPINAKIQNKVVKIRDKAHFIAEYQNIINTKVKSAISKQTYGKLFANSRGVMIGEGEVWVSGVGDKGTVKIIAINN